MGLHGAGSGGMFVRAKTSRLSRVKVSLFVLEEHMAVPRIACMHVPLMILHVSARCCTTLQSLVDIVLTTSSALSLLLLLPAIILALQGPLKIVP